MPTSQEFTIRKAFLLPLGLLLALCIVLFVLCLIQGQPLAKTIILGFMIIPVVVLFIESAHRRAAMGALEVTVFKFLRKKTLAFSDVTAVETVLVRKRAYLTICAGEDFLILSNAYANFPELVQVLLAKVPRATVSEETLKMAENPPIKSTDIVSCWLAVALLGLILYIQLGGKL